MKGVKMMRIFNKFLFGILVIVAMLCFVGCEDNSLDSQLRRAQEQSRAANDAYEKALGDYNNLMDDYQNYQDTQDYLNNFD